jgi:hypothetical protein
MSNTRKKRRPRDFSHLPADLREFAERLTAAGISFRLANVGPDDPLPEPIRANTSLSDAIIEERDEYYD